MEVKFVNPKLSSDSKNGDILNAIQQFNEVNEYIEKLKKQNYDNYALFITEYRDIIKRNIPIVGKVYRFINKSDFGYNYEFKQYINDIEYLYVSFASLKKDTHWGRFMPTVKCIPLNKEGRPIPCGKGSYLCIDSYKKGEDVDIIHFSIEDYPEMLKVFKKVTSKTHEDELEQYRRLQRKFEKS